MMVNGHPKSGKSKLIMEFAQYLAQARSNTLQVVFEEGFGYTLEYKIQRVRATSTNLSFAANMPSNLEGQDFVFIDSISLGGMELEDLRNFKKSIRKLNLFTFFIQRKMASFGMGTIIHMK